MDVPRLRGLLRRPTPHQLQEIGRREHLRLTDAEAQEYATIIDSMLESYDALDAFDPQHPAGPERTMTLATRGGPPEDTVNAFLRTCSVKIAATGTLEGVRVGMKDTIAVAGIPLSNGSRTAPHVPTQDALVTERLLAAGAEIVGVLNMDDWSSGGTGETSAFGPPLNPTDPTRSAGGSSGGSGAAVAAGLVDVALGVDQAGSGRIPASYCGVVALKPTHGLVPSHGVTHTAHSIDAVSPTAATVAMVARTTDALAGFDERDPQAEFPAAYGGSLTAALGGGVRGLRVGIIEESLAEQYCSEEMRLGIERATRALEDAGAEVVPIHCPVWESSWPIAVASLCQLGWAMLQSDGQGTGHHGEVDVERVRNFAMTRRLEADDYPPFMKVWLLLGRYMHEDYLSVHTARAQNARLRVRAEVTSLFDQVDLLVSPTTPTTAPKLEIDDRGDFEVLNRGLNGINSAIFNLSGHPAIAVPSGVGSTLLPTSVQITGAHFADDLVIRAAEVIEMSLSEGR